MRPGAFGNQFAPQYSAELLSVLRTNIPPVLEDGITEAQYYQNARAYGLQDGLVFDPVATTDQLDERVREPAQTIA